MDSKYSNRVGSLHFNTSLEDGIVKGLTWQHKGARLTRLTSKGSIGTRGKIAEPSR